MIPEYKPWTAAEEEILRQLWTDRKSAEEIGKAMERTKNAIIARACKLQLGKRRPHKVRDANTLNEVRRMVREGMSTGAIAKALGFHETTVREWRREMGLAQPLSGKQIVRVYKPSPFKPEAFEMRPAEIASDGGNGIAFGTARHGECKWPLWADADRTGNVCGCAAMPGRPYCEAHSARAYRAKPVQAQTEAA